MQGEYIAEADMAMCVIWPGAMLPTQRPQCSSHQEPSNNDLDRHTWPFFRIHSLLFPLHLLVPSGA